MVPVRTASATRRRSSTRSATLAPTLTSSMRVGHGRQAVERQPAPQPLREPLGEAPGRPPVDLDHVGPVDVVGVGADAQVGQGGPHAGAVEDAGPQHRVDRHARLDQGHLGGQEQGVDPGQHGDVGARHARLGQPAGHHVGHRRRPAVGGVEADGEGARGGVGVGAGTDLLGHPPPVVRQQVAGGVDHLHRAAVVDLQGMVGGGREEAVEVRRGSRGRRRRGRR